MEKSILWRFFALAVLLSALIVLYIVPAYAAPCCQQCPSWPNLDPPHDGCARWCIMCGQGGQCSSDDECLGMICCYGYCEWNC